MESYELKSKKKIKMNGFLEELRNCKTLVKVAQLIDATLLAYWYNKIGLWQGNLVLRFGSVLIKKLFC